MKKKVLATVLTFGMLASLLVGCGGTTSASSASDDNASSESSAASGTSIAESSTSEAEDDTETVSDTSAEAVTTESVSAKEAVELATPGADEGYTLGISVLNMTGQFFIELVNAAQEEADATGCTLMTNDAKNDSATQITALENFISAGCDGIIVCAVDAEATATIVAEAKEAGIAVVCLTSKVEGYDAYVGVDEYTLGYTQGAAVGKILSEVYGDEKIEAATLNYDLMESVVARKEGIIAGVQENDPNVEFVADATAADQEEGMTNTENFLQAHPDLKVVCGVSDGAALGAYQAFKAAGMDDPSKYLIAGIDATEEALKLINEGTIYQVSVDQNPKETGKILVDTACAIKDGTSYPKDSLYNLIAVTPDNISDYDLN